MSDVSVSSDPSFTHASNTTRPRTRPRKRCSNTSSSIWSRPEGCSRSGLVRRQLQSVSGQALSSQPVKTNDDFRPVFDMSGFGLSNMDWDTATMVIKIFQSYYPETLGHAIIWNSPTVFSAVWKIVKPMLDPVVREKIHFASSASDIAKVSRPAGSRVLARRSSFRPPQYIDPKHLEKDFGGTSSWTYRFRQPAKGENEHMKDEDAKKKRVEAYEVATKVSSASVV